MVKLPHQDTIATPWLQTPSQDFTDIIGDHGVDQDTIATPRLQSPSQDSTDIRGYPGGQVADGIGNHGGGHGRIRSELQLAHSPHLPADALWSGIRPDLLLSNLRINHPSECTDSMSEHSGGVNLVHQDTIVTPRLQTPSQDFMDIIDDHGADQDTLASPRLQSPSQDSTDIKGDHGAGFQSFWPGGQHTQATLLSGVPQGGGLLSHKSFSSSLHQTLSPPSHQTPALSPQKSDSGYLFGRGVSK
jgi:hypothetical protein